MKQTEVGKEGKDQDAAGGNYEKTDEQPVLLRNGSLRRRGIRCQREAASCGKRTDTAAMRNHGNGGRHFQLAEAAGKILEQ